MIRYAQIVFPFRVITFISIYILINVIYYNRDLYAREETFLFYNKFNYISTNLPTNFINFVANHPGESSMFREVRRSIVAWGITADVFIALLFVCIILGFITPKAHMSFLISVLHFIGTLLLYIYIIHDRSIGLIISAVVIGILLPFLIELWNIFGIFVFKRSFYFSSQ